MDIPSQSRFSRLGEPVLIAIAGLLLVWAGVGEATDGIVRYVVRIVDGIDWLDVWRPVVDPPPMNTVTYRPLTVVQVKLLLALTSGSTVAMTALHGLVLPWFGLAVRRFVRAHGLAHVALPTALSVMLLPSMLFSAWIPVEPDVMGAAFLCEAGAALSTWQRTRARRSLLWLGLMAFGAATTKETSAAAAFAYFGLVAWHGRGDRSLRHVFVSYAVGLFVLVLPLLLAKVDAPHGFHVANKDFEPRRAAFLVLHNLAQVFYLVGSAGAALVLVLLAPRSWLLGPLVLVVLLAPPLRLYNHYESVIIDQWAYVVLSMLPLLAGLCALAVRGDVRLRVLAGTTLSLFAILVVAPVLARQSRPDVSARLFAPIVPMLYALAWHGLSVAWVRGGSVRVLGAVLGTCLAAFGPMNASNTVQQFRARMAVEQRAKLELATRLRDPAVFCPFVIATNRDNELAAEELEALGVTWTRCSEIFVPNKLRLDPGDEEFPTWQLQGHAYSLRPTDPEHIRGPLVAGHAPDACTYVFLERAKAMMDTSDFERFSGDFAWAFENLPEFDREVHRQQVEIQYRETTCFERLFKRAGATEATMSADYVWFPLLPNELVMRLWRGLPFVELYEWRIDVLALEGCRGRSLTPATAKD